MALESCVCACGCGWHTPLTNIQHHNHIISQSHPLTTIHLQTPLTHTTHTHTYTHTVILPLTCLLDSYSHSDTNTNPWNCYTSICIDMFLARNLLTVSTNHRRVYCVECSRYVAILSWMGDKRKGGMTCFSELEEHGILSNLIGLEELFRPIRFQHFKLAIPPSSWVILSLSKQKKTRFLIATRHAWQYH